MVSINSPCFVDLEYIMSISVSSTTVVEAYNHWLVANFTGVSLQKYLKVTGTRRRNLAYIPDKFEGL